MSTIGTCVALAFVVLADWYIRHEGRKHARTRHRSRAHGRGPRRPTDRGRGPGSGPAVTGSRAGRGEPESPHMQQPPTGPRTYTRVPTVNAARALLEADRHGA